MNLVEACSAAEDPFKVSVLQSIAQLFSSIFAAVNICKPCTMYMPQPHAAQELNSFAAMLLS